MYVRICVRVFMVVIPNAKGRSGRGQLLESPLMRRQVYPSFSLSFSVLCQRNTKHFLSFLLTYHNEVSFVIEVLLKRSYGSSLKRIPSLDRHNKHDNLWSEKVNWKWYLWIWMTDYVYFWELWVMQTSPPVHKPQRMFLSFVQFHRFGLKPSSNTKHNEAMKRRLRMKSTSFSQIYPLMLKSTKILKATTKRDLP